MLLLIRALSLVGVPILISPSILISDPVLLSPPILIFYNIRVRVCINRGSFSFNCSQTVMPQYETRILSTRSSNRTSKKAHWESFYLRYWCKWHCQRYRRRNRSKFPHVNWTEHSSYICYCYSVCCCSAMDSGFRIPDSGFQSHDSGFFVSGTPSFSGIPRIPWAVFQTPTPRIADSTSKLTQIPDSTSKNFLIPESGFLYIGRRKR